MRVFASWPLPISAAQKIKSSGFELAENPVPELISAAKLSEHATEADGLIVLLSETIDGAFLDRHPHLKVVANVAVGYNNIDIGRARELGIRVCNTPDILTAATADLTVTLLLSLVRKIVPADAFLRAGKFTGWRPDLFTGSDLTGKTAGIFGMGKIGRAVAKRLQAFDVNIIYHNRKPLPPEQLSELNARYVDFEHLLKESDFIIVLAPLTPETNGRFAATEFAAMKKGAYFINAARGAIMDEDALADSLERGHLAGAGLDVFEFEPKVNPRLIGRENVVLLPHIGSAGRETREAMFVLAAENVVKVLNSEEPPTPVV